MSQTENIPKVFFPKKLINARFFFLIVFSCSSTKILDPCFQGFVRPYAFALLLEEWCWDLTANVNCSEIPDHIMGGDDTAFPLQSF